MKTKKYKLYSTVVLMFIGLTFTACLDFDELRENPNQPNSVPPSLVFTQLTPGPVNSFAGSYEKPQYHLWIATDNVYPPDFRSGFDGSFNYGDIRNINQMMLEAEKANAPEYNILGKFFKARIYLEMTRRMGDIPLSESALGEENPQPKYDSQKSVYVQCLNWLDEANNELGAFISANPGTILEGDLYYGGNLGQWQRMINAYTLRILVSLSKKAEDSELNVKGRFQSIVGNPDKYPLFRSLADNAEFYYSNEDGFRQSYNPDQAVYRDAIVYASTYIDLLKDNEDPRLMKVADPTKAALEANPGDEEAVRADYDAYAGADVSQPATDNSAKKLDGLFFISTLRKVLELHRSARYFNQLF